MANQVIISVKDVHKSFKLPHEKYTGLKQALVNFRPGKKFEMQHVLKGVSFDIKKGEFFGIVGRNGSGKSTLLKLLAQIYTPEQGAVQVNGSLTPFIELGVGFNPELTGRENIYLNGALLGFDRKQVDAMYKGIVDFAELHAFMDQKLKNYSSGMQVRLAFSIAIRAESDILLIDEVLAVGDTAFQEKCFAIFDAYKAEGRTVILVTHDMGIVKKFCNRALYVEQGKITNIGSPEIISEEYRRANEKLIDTTMKEKEKKIAGGDINIALSTDGDSRSLYSGAKVKITLKYENIKEQVGGGGIAIYKSTGEYVFGANTYRDSFRYSPGADQLEYNIQLSIGEGTYMVKAALFGENEEKIVRFIDEGPKFRIVADDQEWEGITNLKRNWRN